MPESRAASSPAPRDQQGVQEVPLKIVGGNLFGRYPKISVEQTFNMIVSDDFLVDYAGYQGVLPTFPNSPGRGIYASAIGGFIATVWGGEFYITTYENGMFSAPMPKGVLTTSSGDVFMAENNNMQIGITDGEHLYVYNYGDQSFKISVQTSPGTNQFLVPFTDPGYISFQNGRMIVADTATRYWYISNDPDATIWPALANSQGQISTKPDRAQAAVPFPGGGNNLLVFGHTVAEQWQDVAYALFPYQRSSTFNVDYGCLNPSSIASLENYVVWLAANEQAGVTIMVCTGNQVQTISTDGMDFKFATLTTPSNCTGFLFRQDGHLLYQFTFPADNLSYVYDFNTKLFFTVTDENLNYHIARNVVFFNNQYYFVSLKGGNLYQFGTQFTNFNYGQGIVEEIPRIRICPPLRLPSQRFFVAKSLGFTIENGQPNNIITITESFGGNSINLDTEDSNDILTEDGNFLTTEGAINPTVYTYQIASEVVDLSISRDGGENFGSFYRLPMNPTGIRKSRFIYQRLGQANDATFQLQFHGFGRFVCTDGIVEVYQ